MPSSMLTLKAKLRRVQKKFTAFLFDILHLKLDKQLELYMLNHKMTTEQKMSTWLDGYKIPEYCLVVKNYQKKKTVANQNYCRNSCCVKSC